MNSPYVFLSRGRRCRGDVVFADLCPRSPPSLVPLWRERGEIGVAATDRCLDDTARVERSMFAMTNDPKPHPPPTPLTDETIFEVRTRRLVITDDDDRPRIVAEVVNGVAELRLDVPGELPRAASVTLYANPGDDLTGDPSVGVQLWGAGESRVELNLWLEGGRWVAGNGSEAS
jgi:hypothetical protein